MDSIGVAVDHVQTPLNPVPLEEFHFIMGTRLNDELLSVALTKEKRECSGGGGYDGACVTARTEAGLLSVYRYVLGKPRDGVGGLNEEVEHATRGMWLLEKAAKSSVRAQFIWGLTLASTGPLLQSDRGLAAIVQSIEGGYEPVGFLELFYTIQAFSERIKMASTGRAENRASDAASVILYSERLIEAPDSSHDANIYNLHGVVLQFCETLLRQEDWSRAAEQCEEATALNPVEESQYGRLAIAYRNLGDATKEEGALRRALELAPTNSQARSRLAQLLLSRETVDETLSTFLADIGLPGIEVDLTGISYQPSPGPVS